MGAKGQLLGPAPAGRHSLPCLDGAGDGWPTPHGGTVNISTQTVLAHLTEMGADVHPDGRVTGNNPGDLHLETGGGRIVLTGRALDGASLVLDRDDPKATAFMCAAVLGLDSAAGTFADVLDGLHSLGDDVTFGVADAAFVVSGPEGQVCIVGYRDGIAVQDPCRSTTVAHGWSWSEIARPVMVAVGVGQSL